MSRPKKIIISGLPGTGKTTVAKILGDNLHLPVIVTDSYFFDSNWVRKKKEEIIEIMEELVSGSEWIIDGMYGDIVENFLGNADLVVYIKTNILKTLTNLVKRKTGHLLHKKKHNYSNKRIFMGAQTIKTTILKRVKSRRKWNDIIRKNKDTVKIISINDTRDKTIIKLLDEIRTM